MGEKRLSGIFVTCQGQKLTADGMTKPLQGHAFGRFLTGLDVIDAPVRKFESQEDPNILKAQAPMFGGLWWQKLLVLGALMIRLGKEWSWRIGALLVALVRWKSGQQKSESGSQPRLCAFRVPGDHHDQLPIRPSRNPLESQAGQRGYAARSAGSSDGDDEPTSENWYL